MSRSILFATDVAIRHPSREWSRRFTEDPGPDKHQGWEIDVQSPDRVVLKKAGVTVTVSGIGYSLVEGPSGLFGRLPDVTAEQVKDLGDRMVAIVQDPDSYPKVQELREMVEREMRDAKAEHPVASYASRLPEQPSPPEYTARPDLEVPDTEPEQRPAPKKRGRRGKHR